MTAIRRIAMALCAAFVASCGSKVFADGFSVELLSENPPGVASQDGETIWAFNTNATIRVNGTGVFDVLVVGGGGGGGYKGGGGGGGGGVIYTQQMVVASGEYNLVVGLGGKGAQSNTIDSTCGGDSEAFGLVAHGGGAGGTYSSPNGKDGASGGGGGTEYPWSSRTKALGGSGVPGQGHDGGKGCNTNYADYQGGTNSGSPIRSVGGGGGGAGSAGTDAWYDSDVDKVKGGNGGNGVLCEIYGSKYYGGGGGGGTSNKRASATEDFCGGAGEGGNGGVTAGSPAAGEDGMDGFGGGGGGGGCGTQAAGANGGVGGNGGSGVVIIRWRQPEPSEKDLPDGDLAVGGTVRHRNGYAIHKFDASGSFVLSEPTLVDILLVGGGGGGGSRSGGGGGGGGVVVVSNAYLLAGSYAVTVGEGGAGAANAGVQGASGTDSVFSFGSSEAYDFRAVGGGYGGSSAAGAKGGSGGGGGAPYVPWSTLEELGGAGTDGQGHAGGKGVHKYTGNSINDWSSSQAGGGGGAGELGGNGTTNAPGVSVTAPGNGGNGIVCDFSGEPLYYGGGGGGGSATYNNASPYYISLGGLGGGGRGGSAQYYDNKLHASAGENGVDGLGGGGGGSGGASDAASTGGDGGDGVVIIRYRVRRKGFILKFY